MKMLQDFNEEFENYSNQIEKEIANLNRMKEEMRLRCSAAQKIIIEIESVLKKLHLKIDEFFISNPSKNESFNRGALRFDLIPDDDFKFIRFTGYMSNGAAKNYNALSSKASKIKSKIENSLKSLNLDICCDVNPYSLEEDDELKKQRVLMEIFYKF